MPFVTTSNLEMHYETGGGGKEVMVLVHGNFASWRWWQPVLKNMKNGCCAYAPDMRGCGDTEQPAGGYTIAQHAEDLGRFVDALNFPRVHLVGHSLDGCVALEYALAHPDRLKSLTLVAPAPAEGNTVLNHAGANGKAYANAFSVEMR